MENLIGTRKSKRLKGRKVAVHHFSRKNRDDLKSKTKIVNQKNENVNKTKKESENIKEVKEKDENKTKIGGRNLKRKAKTGKHDNENKVKKLKQKEESWKKNQQDELENKEELTELETNEEIDQDANNVQEKKVEDNCNEEEENVSSSEGKNEPPKCKICDKHFKSLSGLNQHVRLTHGLFCRPCQAHFDSKEELSSHELEKHSILRQDNGEKLFKCEICNKLCKDRTKFEFHKRSHDTKLLFKCEICGKMLKTESTLRYHAKIKHDSSQKRCFKCDICDKEFWNNSELKKHGRVHSNDRPFLCHYCSMSFKTIGNLTNHERAVHGTKKWSCDVCGKRFTHKKKSLEHCFEQKYAMEKPPPIKSFSCKGCGKLFARKNDLKIHFRIHSGDKPYKCNVCGKDFRCSNHLKQHEVIHTGEKPFICKFCRKGFSQIANVRCHMRKCKFKVGCDLVNGLEVKVEMGKDYDENTNTGKSQMSELKGNNFDVEQPIQAQDLIRDQKLDLAKLFSGNKSKNSLILQSNKDKIASTLNVCEKGTQSEIVYPSTEQLDKFEEKKKKVMNESAKIIFVDGDTTASGLGQLNSLVKIPVTNSNKDDGFKQCDNSQNSLKSNILKMPMKINLGETIVQNLSLKPLEGDSCEPNITLIDTDQKTDQTMPQIDTDHKTDQTLPQINTDQKIDQTLLQIDTDQDTGEGPKYFYEAEVLNATSETEQNISQTTSESLYEGLVNDSSHLQNVIVIPEISMNSHVSAASESGIILNDSSLTTKEIQIPLVDNDSSGVIFAEIDDNGVFRYVPLNDPGNTTTVILEGIHPPSNIASEYESLIYRVEDLNNEQTAAIKSIENSDIL